MIFNRGQAVRALAPFLAKFGYDARKFLGEQRSVASAAAVVSAAAVSAAAEQVVAPTLMGVPLLVAAASVWAI
jgi:hypothetical protein